MLTNILTNTNFETITICLLSSIVLGFIIAISHKLTSNYNKNFLITITLLYLFPSNKDLKVKELINYYEEKDLKSVYLIDKYNYVSKLKVPIYEQDLLDMVKEKLEYLIINNEKESLIPNGFRPIIPVDTSILDLKLDNDILIINFSKELLNINSKDEESMIESIIFTVTEFESIKNVIIKVEYQNCCCINQSNNLYNVFTKNKTNIKYLFRTEE